MARPGGFDFAARKTAPRFGDDWKPTRALIASVKSRVQALEHPVHVLVVEGNLVNRTVAVRTLKKLGCKVDAAVDGIDAIHQLEGQVFNLVLMDVQMPKMDGLEATKRIRELESHEGTAHLPGIAMTAHALAEDRERCFNVGMDGYLTKPIDLSELSETILQWAEVPG